MKLGHLPSCTNLPVWRQTPCSLRQQQQHLRHSPSVTRPGQAVAVAFTPPVATQHVPNTQTSPSNLLRSLAIRMPSSTTPSVSQRQPKWKSMSVLGLSQAMVDFTASVPDSFLEQCKVAKGSRRVISLQERHEVIESLDHLGCSSTVGPGGSVANTLVAIARLSAASGGAPVRVSMAGSVGTDALGCYFNAQMKKAGVNMLVDPMNPSHTGTVMVLSTPDAQRSFLSFFDSSELKLTPHFAQAIADTKMLVIEGYMLELPGAEECLVAVASLARSLGVQVALTAGDPGVVDRHRTAMQNLMSSGLVDILFSNCDEANALLKGVVPGSVGFGSFTHTQPGSSRQQEERMRGVLASMRHVTGDLAHTHSCGCEDGVRTMEEGKGIPHSPHECGAHQVEGLEARIQAHESDSHSMSTGGSCSASSGSVSSYFSSQASVNSMNSNGGSACYNSSSDTQAGPEEYSAYAAVVAIAPHVPMVIVTDGARGSCIGVRGLVYQLPSHLIKDPVDVCGAGDAYAAGVLFAIMQGHDMHTAGQFAARVAAAVVSRHTAQLTEVDAEALVQHLPNHVLLPQHWPEASATLP